MKKILITLGSFLLLYPALAQHRFEGRIGYLMSSPDSNIQVKIQAWYGYDLIRFTYQVIKSPDKSLVPVQNETVILDFRNGNIDRLKPREKIVEREKMTSGKGRKQDIPDLSATGRSREILQRRCKEYTSGLVTKQEPGDSTQASLNITIWYADDMAFNVVDSLKMIQMVPLFSNGHIALGSEIQVQKGPVSLLLRTEAVEIDPSKEKLPASLFRAPRNYKLKISG